jgi:hypothetical protein
VSEGLLFGIGSVIFIFVSAAILFFGYARFQAIYLRDQDPGVAEEESGLDIATSAAASGDST